MNKKPLCIYHHGCADGFAAAWIVRKYYRMVMVDAIAATNLPPECFNDEPVDFHPGIYGDTPPDVTGRDVILVDFSYKRPAMLALIEQARSVLIIDHHESAERELQDLPIKATTIFAMDRSGAMLTWEHYFLGQQPPLVIDHIQDRDLWKFKLPMTKEICAAVFSYPMTFKSWDELMRRSILELEREGRAIQRKHNQDVDALIEATPFLGHVAGVEVPIANVPWMYASEVAGQLAKGHPFAATYYDDADGRRWSLRSDNDGANVAEIAESLGGGGHKHAAGFRMTREQVQAWLTEEAHRV